MTSNKIKVFAPASIANVSCGFDIFGFALPDLGDYVEVWFNESGKLVIESITGADGLPTKPELNVTTVAAQALLEAVGEKRGVSFNIQKTVKPGSGLGSSSSAAVAGAFAVNELLGNPFTLRELLPFAGVGEQLASNQLHFDNVAPSLFGGFSVVRSNEEMDVLSISYPKDLWVVAAHPQVEIKTKQAKRMLGRTMPISNAVIQWGNVAGLVLALTSNDYDLLGRSMVDMLAEPKRSKLIPHYDKAKDATLAAGAIGTNIAGSGPTIFSFCKGEASANKVMSAYKKVYGLSNLEVNYYKSKINPEGAKRIK
ncbi:MAG: homoserine kinase [Cyclobacteriaceae bacterium]|nr:homoserine kinase [Cyclobacteriaceae bacterium]